MSAFKYLDLYEQQIKEGKAVVGQWMAKNIEYVKKGLENQDFFYDEKKAELRIRFIENFCHHVKGSKELIKLEVWQKYLVACIFGLVGKDGKRQFKEIVFVCGRKQGKSLLASSLQNAVLYTESESGMEIYNLAPKLQQARIIYDVACEQIANEKSLRKRVRKRRTDIYKPDSASSMLPLAFNSKKSDGFNPSWVTYDEFAAWKGEQSLSMYNVMLSGSGSRDMTNSSIHFSCSTANFEDDGLYDALITRSSAILNGSSDETRLLPFIYMIDDESKWDDIQELKKALPNLGVSVPVSFIEDEIVKAKTNNTYKPEFMTKYANVKQNSSFAWLSGEEIRKTQGKKLTPEMFSGMYAVGGVDLSQTTDLTAATVVIQHDGKDYALTRFFMPFESFKKQTETEKVNYPKFLDLGYLQISGEHYVDYSDVTAWFEELTKKYKIHVAVIGYDRYSSQYWVNEMKGKGFKMDDVIQGTNLSPIIDNLHGEIKAGLFHTGANGLLQSHFKNSALEQNYNDKRMRLTKVDRSKHIDGVASVLDALTVRSKYWDRYSWSLQNKGKGIKWED